ncbi:MAG: hypothetical protein J6T32_05265 [Paludibacteraceae bacterium]|nr:hypothetical protein [Paludibacteraceae bacterium]
MKKITLLLLSLLTMSTLFAQKPVSILPLHAPQATQEVVNLVASDFTFDQNTYSEHGFTWFTLYTTDYSFHFAIKLPLNQITFGKVYTLTDMDEEYTAKEDEESIYLATAATFKATVDASMNFIVEASLTYGTTTYNITYGLNLNDPVELNLTATNYNCIDAYAQNGFTQYALSTSDYVFYFAINLPLASITENTVYTLENMNAQYSWVSLGEDASASYSSATYKQYTDAEGRLHVEATVTFNYASTTYTVNISYVRDATPAEYTMVDLTMEEVRFVEGQGYCDFGGMTADGTYMAILDYLTTGSVVGEFDENACEVAYNTFKKNDETLQLVKVTAKVVAIENGYKAEAWFYAYDGNCYHCTFVYTIPQPTTKVNLTVTNAEIDEHLGQQSSFVDILAADNNYTMQLEVNTLAISGSYTEANLNGTFSFFRDANNKMYSVYTANITIEEIGDGVYHITGTVLCYGDVEFTLDLTTGSSTGIEDIKADGASLRKVYENGVLYFVRPDGTIYNAAGTRIR